VQLLVQVRSRQRDVSHPHAWQPQQRQPRFSVPGVQTPCPVQLPQLPQLPHAQLELQVRVWERVPQLPQEPLAD
jgi:hypothetical protein